LGNENGKEYIKYAQLICKKFAVRFYDKENRVFQIQSDIAKTMYKYYYDGLAEKPEILHV
jgi:hypothetical protein